MILGGVNYSLSGSVGIAEVGFDYFCVGCLVVDPLCFDSEEALFFLTQRMAIPTATITNTAPHIIMIIRVMLLLASGSIMGVDDNLAAP